MTRLETVVFIGSIWACVYPGVLIFSYAFQWLAPNLPIWLQIGISTLITVPFISLFCTPQIEKLLAKARRESLSQFKHEQAEAVE
jgi:antibiotic biosynthesis monooxygenase (ABM) superfamily enzyme